MIDPGGDHRALIFGSRSNWRRSWVLAQLDAIDRVRSIETVIEGGQRRWGRLHDGIRDLHGGVDGFAWEWAELRGRNCVTFPANWAGFGHAAGPMRNREMLDRGRVGFGIEFPGGTGTADMGREARRRELPLIVVADHARLVYVPRLTVELCREKPDALHVFGDNLVGRGKRGQAAIRDEPNAVGIPTKRAPREDAGAYFTDDDIERFRDAAAVPFARLSRHLQDGGTVYWPEGGVGTGLGELNTRAPRLFAALDRAEVRLAQIAAQRASYAI